MANQNNPKTKKHQIPMIVTDEVIRDFGIKHEDVIWRRINNRKYRVVMIDSTEEEYSAYMEPIWLESKREEREGRCMVKGKTGKLIRCPETNHCEQCKHFSETCRERNKTTSLTALIDMGVEPTTESKFEDNILYQALLEDLISMLNTVNPKYGRIFRLLYDGATQQEMAQDLGIKQQTVSNYIRKIRNLVQPLVKDILYK